MAEFWQQVVSGLASGGIYASLALAIVLIYRATRVINFAQGEMAMFTTFIAWWLVTQEGVPYWAAFFLVLAMAFVGGVLVERIVIKPIERAPVVTIVIVTIGLLLALNGAAFAIWGGAQNQFPANRPFPTRGIHVGGVSFSLQDIGVIGVSIGLVLALWVFFRFTKLGLALRAACVNPVSARLVGIRTSWMLALGWGLAAVLGAVAGLMAATSFGSTFDYTFMLPVLPYALAAAVLGGLESPAGAVVGGLALGVGLNLLGTYVSFVGTELKLPAALALILLVLLVRPQGLFGREAVRRV